MMKETTFSGHGSKTKAPRIIAILHFALFSRICLINDEPAFDGCQRLRHALICMLCHNGQPTTPENIWIHTRGELISDYECICNHARKVASDMRNSGKLPKGIEVKSHGNACFSVSVERILIHGNILSSDSQPLGRNVIQISEVDDNGSSADLKITA